MNEQKKYAKSMSIKLWIMSVFFGLLVFYASYSDSHNHASFDAFLAGAVTVCLARFAFYWLIEKS